MDVKIEHLKKLWTMLIKDSVTPVEKNTFLDFLVRKKDPKNPQKKNVTYILNEGLMKELFDEIFFYDRYFWTKIYWSTDTIRRPFFLRPNFFGQN